MVKRYIGINFDGRIWEGDTTIDLRGCNGIIVDREIDRYACIRFSTRRVIWTPSTREELDGIEKRGIGY